MAGMRFALRRGTAEQWTSVDPILADGEEGYEKDTRRRKIGDGVHRWSELSYESAGGGFDQEAVDATIMAALEPYALTADVQAAIADAISQAIARLPADAITTTAQVQAIVDAALVDYTPGNGGVTQEQFAALQAAVAAIPDVDTTDLMPSRVSVQAPSFALEPDSWVAAGNVYLVGIPDAGQTAIALPPRGGSFHDTTGVIASIDDGAGREWFNFIAWQHGPRVTGGIGSEGGFGVAIDGVIYFGGGDGNYGGDDGYGRWLMSYDPASGQFAELAMKPSGFDYGAYAVADGRLYTLGGEDWVFGTPYPDLPFEMYDPATDAWTVLPSLPRGFDAYGVEPTDPNENRVSLDQTQGVQSGRWLVFASAGLAWHLDEQRWAPCADPALALLGQPWRNGQGAVAFAPDGRIWVTKWNVPVRVLDATDPDPAAWTWIDYEPPAPGVEPVHYGESGLVFNSEGDWFHLGAGPRSGGAGGGAAVYVGDDGALVRLDPPAHLPGITWPGNMTACGIDECAAVIIDDIAYMVMGYVFGEDDNDFDYVAPYLMPFDTIAKTWGEPILVPAPSFTANDPTVVEPLWNYTLAEWCTQDDLAFAPNGFIFTSFAINSGDPSYTVPPTPVLDGWTFRWGTSGQPSSVTPHQTQLELARPVLTGTIIRWYGEDGSILLEEDTQAGSGGGTVINALSEIADVQDGAPSPGDMLKWNGGSWAFVQLPEPEPTVEASTLSRLTLYAIPAQLGAEDGPNQGLIAGLLPASPRDGTDLALESDGIHFAVETDGVYEVTVRGNVDTSFFRLALVPSIDPGGGSTELGTVLTQGDFLFSRAVWLRGGSSVAIGYSQAPPYPTQVVLFDVVVTKVFNGARGPEGPEGPMGEVPGISESGRVVRLTGGPYLLGDGAHSIVPIVGTFTVDNTVGTDVTSDATGLLGLTAAGHYAMRLRAQGSISSGLRGFGFCLTPPGLETYGRAGLGGFGPAPEFFVAVAEDGTWSVDTTIVAWNPYATNFRLGIFAPLYNSEMSNIGVLNEDSVVLEQLSFEINRVGSGARGPAGPPGVDSGPKERAMLGMMDAGTVTYDPGHTELVAWGQQSDPPTWLDLTDPTHPHLAAGTYVHDLTVMMESQVAGAFGGTLEYSMSTATVVAEGGASPRGYWNQSLSHIGNAPYEVALTMYLGGIGSPTFKILTCNLQITKIGETV